MQAGQACYNPRLLLKSAGQNTVQMLVIGKVVAGLFGSALLWIAFFCFEDEEGKMQNVLEKWWISIDESRKTALSIQVVFIQRVAKQAADAFDWLFGPLIVSSRALCVSLCLSLASLAVGIAIYEADWDESLAGSLVVIVAALFCLALASFPAVRFRRRNTRWNTPWCVFVVALGLYFWGCAILGERGTFIVPQSASEGMDTFSYGQWVRLCALSSFLLLTSLGCDVGFILLTRRALQLISNATSIVRIVAILIMTYGIGALFVGIPWYRFIFRAYYHSSFYPEGSDWLFVRWNDIATVLTYSNLLDGVVVSVFLAIGLVTLGHRLLWPIIERPLYALASLGIVRRRKLLSSVGVLMLSVAFGKPMDWLSKIIEATR
jgi:hypothetical protein